MEKDFNKDQTKNANGEQAHKKMCTKKKRNPQDAVMSEESRSQWKEL